MKDAGPDLPALLRRIAETAPAFLAEPRVGGHGEVAVAAVVKDLFDRRGLPLPLDRLQSLHARTDLPALRIGLLLCGLLDSPELRSGPTDADRLYALLTSVAAELAAEAPAPRWMGDADRREELARVALASLDLRPAGESLAQAQDRLSAISAVERSRILRATQLAEERARRLREALARKAAEEAADKWTRE